MRLRSLEIQGFKSFPDKTKLEFGQGITAVVGPNGSGKSNISDAVRWVLGEQSTKTLRGGKMEDVIFGGTQTRRPQSYTSVRMDIENPGGEIPGYGEIISITRKLYRSGESEYRINDTMVRLRDIHELFMDTGLGRDGYSIIGQGRISEIVSAKSAGRREIFEEATGISKFRFRKTESERQLSKAEENLVRLRDILSELEERVGPLKIQSQKAKEYVELAGEKRGLEISLWLIKLEKIKEDLKAQEQKLDISKNEYDRLEMQSRKFDEETAEIYREIQNTDILTEEARLNIRSLEEKQARLNSDIAVLQNDIAHNNTNIKRTEDELLSFNLSKDEVTGLLKQKEEELAVLNAQYSSALSKDEGIAQRINDQKGAAAKLLEETLALNTKKETIQKTIDEIKMQNARSEAIESEGRLRLTTLSESFKAIDNNILDIKNAIEECKSGIEENTEKITGIKNSHTGYNLKLESRKAKLEEINSQISAINTRADQSLAKAKMLEDMEKNMEGFYSSVKYILAKSASGALKGVYGALSSLISVEEAYSVAVETALGAAMQNIVVEDENTAKKAINMLKEAKAGRATFLPLSAFDNSEINTKRYEKYHGFVGTAASLVNTAGKYKNIVSHLLGKVLVTENLDHAAVIAKSENYKVRIVTLDGQVINYGGSFTGGSNVKSAGVLGRRFEIDKLILKSNNLKAEATALYPGLKKVKEEVSSLEAYITGSAGELRTAEEENVRLSANLSSLNRSLATALETRDNAEKELSALEARAEEIRAGKASGEELLADLSLQTEDIALKLKSAGERKEAVDIGLESLNEEQNNIKLVILAWEKDIHALSEEITRTKQQLISADDRKNTLLSEKQELLQKNEEIANTIKNNEEEKENIALSIKQSAQSIESTSSKRGELEKQSTHIRQREKEISQKREEISREVARLEEKKNTVQKEYDSIISALWDEYELTRTRASEGAVVIEDVPAASRRLAEVKNKIKNLGTVNVDSIEEYKTVSERYETLKSQIEDIEHSKKELTRMISGLTEEMRTIFAENFKIIAENFTVIFKELFGGGTGSLTLTNEEDILDAGIEINVQPPGKLVKSLSLLSGGEQAFIAIAIYFAILKAKPSPFCFLDEIEAALDEVNVARFAAYLRQMCGKMQFIAITHRRGTMEEADNLYGVTMQEEGVSKLLQLKVSEIESAMKLAK